MGFFLASGSEPRQCQPSTLRHRAESRNTSPYLRIGVLSINYGLNGFNACYVHNDPANNVYYLLNDTGTEWYGLYGGTAGTVQNSQCILRGAGSSRTISGPELTLTFDLQFKRKR